MNPRKHRVSYANVASTLALVVALGSGGAYAAGLAKNSVASKQIKDHSIKAKDLRPDSVTSTAVANGSLTAQDLAPGVGIPPVTVQFEEATVDLADGAKGSYTVFCPPGQQAIGGGGRGDFNQSEATTMTVSRPALAPDNTEAPVDGQSFLGWRATFVNNPGGVTTGILPDVWVVCIPAAG
jgi:hypothetical protein